MSSDPPFAATDITAMFPENAGALFDRGANLGGDIGGVEIVTSLLYNFAPDVTRETIGHVGIPPTPPWNMYYCFYLLNKHVSQTVSNIKIWIYRAMSDPGLGVAIGLDPSGKNGIAQTIPNQFTAPTGVTFKSPFTENSTQVLTLDTLAAGDKLAVWVKQFGNKGMSSIPQASYGIKWSFTRPDTGPLI